MCHNPQVNKIGNMYSCGKCTECHNRYIQHWVFRLQRQQYVTPQCIFLTLTYNYEYLPMNKGKFTLDKRHPQLFLKSLRKKFPHHPIKYVLCGEYGTKFGRPHYHAIMFGLTAENYNEIKACWGKGDIHIGTVTPSSIAYTFKYAVKGDLTIFDIRQTKPYIVMSKGIGLDWAFDVVGYRETRGSSPRVNKSTGEVTTVNWVRRTAIKKAKPHFQQKLNTLLSMPYYVLPTTDGKGTVKMSIPKFYLRTANYDTAELGELYADVMARKYNSIPVAKREIILAMQAKQREYAVIQQTKDRHYTLSKSIM